ncbi:hypothetical protein INR49_006005 [Caranx melampygus]|nr:hypothetical protein INR49_006005 [Caranx melampygus]
MQSTFLQVLFSLSWLLSSHAQVDVGSGLSCVRSSPADVDGQTRITFLRDDPAGLRSLYLTLWSGDMRLQACEVNRSPVATERYRTLCDRSGSQGQETTRSFNSSALLALDASCAPVSSSAPKFPGRSDRDGTEGNARRKRSLVMPGTLWCGRGNDAARYEQLGMFEDTDRCCRDHDHCLHVIYSFTVKYGVFNSNFYTVSHCDCDQRFRQCLQEVNDTVSSMVGYSFFNILQVPCFELKYQKRCTQMYWWGILAAKIKRFKQPSVLPTLLMDFVSPHCFKLLGEKKCHNKKGFNCSGSFSKALDLLGALKKIEEKDTAWVRNSGNDRKRGIPVRLYKRCLRLEREADMAQLR